jgi:hypothetical protein
MILIIRKANSGFTIEFLQFFKRKETKDAKHNYSNTWRAQRLCGKKFAFCIRFGLIFDFSHAVRKIALFLNPNN